MQRKHLELCLTHATYMTARRSRVQSPEQSLTTCTTDVIALQLDLFFSGHDHHSVYCVGLQLLRVGLGQTALARLEGEQYPAVSGAHIAPEACIGEVGSVAEGSRRTETGRMFCEAHVVVSTQCDSWHRPQAVGTSCAVSGYLFHALQHATPQTSLVALNPMFPSSFKPHLFKSCVSSKRRIKLTSQLFRPFFTALSPSSL